MARTSTKRPSLMCLEGDWGSDLRSRLSVEDLLRTLEGYQAPYARVVHRDTATRAEFEHYLDWWQRRTATEFPVLYIALHGATGMVQLPNGEEITIEELTEHIGENGAAGRVIYFGSCKVLKGDTSAISHLCETTGVRAVLGYTKTVDWIESAAFDLLLLNDLATAKNLGSMHPRLARKYGSLTDSLGFRLVTSTAAYPPS